MKKQPVLRIGAVAFILLLFLISGLLGGWYNLSWTARRAITIDNFIAHSSLFDFQIGLDIPYYCLMQEDFGDIRFTTADGRTEIPYWIEEYDAFSNAIVWVRIPFIPALGSTRIYLYYGNQDAMSESNGYEVFDYFDDFNDQDISDWTVICGSWTANNKYLEQMLTANHRKILSPYSFDGPPTGMVVEAKMNYMSTYYAAGNCIFFANDWGGSTGYRFGYHGLNGDGTAIDKIYQWLDSNPTIYTGNYGYTWLKGKVTYDGNGNFTFLLKAPDGISVFLEASDTEYMAPFILGNYCGSHTGLDDLRVRKYTDREPAFAISTEEERQIEKEKLLACSITPPISNRMVFRFALPRSALVSGFIYDCSGRKIATVANREYFSSGEHSISMRREMNQLSSGTYFVRMTINEHGDKEQILSEKFIIIH